ncbi:MAG: methyltransferase domain-containing protein, partial [Vicinamibacterales bacterium]
AAAVSAAGFDVVGHDVSEAMVALARRRAPRATFHVGSFVSAALPPSVAVSAVGEVLNYVFDPANDEAARHRFFARVHEALVPGGVLLFDVAGPDRVPPGGTARSGATGEDWAVVAETRREPGAELVTRTITTFRLVDGAYRRDAEVHPFVLIDPPALADQLRAIGFAVRTVPGYGPASLPPGVVSLVARKAARTPGG